MFIVGIIFLIAATVFVMENRDPVTVHFLGWAYSVSLGVALLVAAVAGAVLIYFSSIIKQAQLRAQVRSAEARARDLERQQRQTASEEEVTRS
ncbi:MAG TPA: lipopolysaccharide assembly protein LapA domain-containing protein [bacterium]|nr:MAG: hypothetical protein A2V59_04255 [Armatimonadetes bacterium RBG_19FT_COMBO_69_19]HET6948185.1 lipopolysaccharide assembly protein LapA domain-containing protein [bacterium]